MSDSPLNEHEPTSCPWPYALPPKCDFKISSFASSHYEVWKAVYLVFGISILLLSLAQMIHLRGRATRVQRRVSPLVITISLTYIIRGIDPGGFDGKMPFFIFALSEAVASACLFSVCFIFAMIWTSLLKAFDAWGSLWTNRLIQVAVGLLVASWILFISVGIAFSIDPWANHGKSMGAVFIVLAVFSLIYAAYMFYVGMLLDGKIKQSIRQAQRPVQSSDFLDDELIECNYAAPLHMMITACFGSCIQVWWQQTTTVKKLMVGIVSVLIAACVSSAVAGALYLVSTNEYYPYINTWKLYVPYAYFAILEYMGVLFMIVVFWRRKPPSSKDICDLIEMNRGSISTQPEEEFKYPSPTSSMMEEFTRDGTEDLEELDKDGKNRVQGVETYKL